MMLIGSFQRARRGSPPGEGGFTMLEVVFSMGIVFVAITGLLYTMGIALVDTALGRQRQVGVAMADQVMEQARGLTYVQLSQGMEYNNITAQSDPNIVTCTGTIYFKKCPAQDPNAERIVYTNQSSLPPYRAPIYPYISTQSNVGVTYTAKTYVTQAAGVPSAGALRVTAVVSWPSAARPGASTSISTQILVTSANGSTDAATNPNGSGSPFFFGTGSISRGSVAVTPNGGVANGVSGFSSWSSLSQDLYNADANITQQQLTSVTGQATMTGSRKSVGGVETVAGDVQDTSTADDDPATAAGTSEAPAPITQPGASSVLSGGGNSLTAGGVAAGPHCPSGTPHLVYASGMETGHVLGDLNTTPTNGTTGYPTYVTMDSTPANVHNGAYSLKITPANARAFALWGQYNSAGSVQSSYSTVVVHFALRLGSLPTSGSELWSVLPSGTYTNPYTIGLKYVSGQFRMYVGTTTYQAASGITPTTGQWYVFDVRAAVGSSTYTADWSVNGSPQTSVQTTGNTASSTGWMRLGTNNTTDTYAAYYDDVMISDTSGDYPLPDSKVVGLVPTGTVTPYPSSTYIKDSANAAIGASSYQSLDEVPVSFTADYMKQIAISSTTWAGVSFQTSETCIKGVSAFAGLRVASAAAAVFQVKTFDGVAETTLFNSPAFLNNVGTGWYEPVFSGASWTQAAVNSLQMRFGYATDVTPNPYWDWARLQIAVPLSAGGGVGTPGSESGGTASVVSATGSPVCGNPSQTDGRACSYATENYSVNPPAVTSTTLDLSGSAAGSCKLYQFTPNATAGTTSVYARRGAGSGGIGTVSESITRYSGSFTFGQLCSSASAGPSGWPGYYVKYDAGSAACTAFAEAGLGSGAPSYAVAGTISFWNGAGLTSFAQPASGIWASQPAAVSSFSSGGFRYDMTADLSSAPSYTTQTPSGASGTANRTMARAVLGAPIVGVITYKVTNASTSAVVADLTMTIDLGTLTAFARQA